MNVYVDLSIISFVVCNIVSLFIIQLLIVKKFKIWVYFLLSLISLLKIFLVLDFNLFLLISIYLSTFIVIYFVDKKRFILNSFLYLFFTNLLPVFMLLFFDGIRLINGILVIEDIRGSIIIIGYFIMMIIFYITTKIIDSLFRLHSYKDYVILEIDNRKLKISAYFDSGNFAKHEEIPVIFLKVNSYNYDLSIFNKPIQITSLNYKKEYNAAKALVTFIEKNESYFVYVCLDDYGDDYHGCDLLLNAYLI